MKNLTLTSITLPLFLVLHTALLAYGDKDINRTDQSGKRQGYWVIKGYMSNDKAYSPDAIVEEGEYKDNRREGLWKRFWPNGKPKSEVNYVFGKPEGHYKIYYETGQMEEEGDWVDSRNVGEFKRWHPSGNMQQLFMFSQNGKRNGVQKYFYENGKLAMEVNIHNGEEHGVCKRYNEDGSLKEEMVFDGGELKPGSSKEYSDKPGGEIVEADPYNKSIGKESTAPEGKVNAAAVFKPNGYNVMYNKNGQMAQAGVYSNGRLWDGKMYVYNSDGILIRIEVYKGGRYLGSGVLEEEEN
jgi:antitoxin component YwqK of YwqJK toxin-antitoxin module